jgi:hypothetical protein
MGDYLLEAVILKITGIALSFGPLSIHSLRLCINFGKNILGYIFADFSQTHLVTLLTNEMDFCRG